LEKKKKHALTPGVDVISWWTKYPSYGVEEQKKKKYTMHVVKYVLKPLDDVRRLKKKKMYTD